MSSCFGTALLQVSWEGAPTGGGFISFCHCHRIPDLVLDNEPNMPLLMVLGTSKFETEGVAAA